MKNAQRTVLVRTFGAMRSIAIIALLAVIGFSVAACVSLGDVTKASTSKSVAPISINGVWEGDGGHLVNINGSTGTFTAIYTSPIWQSAVEKGYAKTGDPKFRNIKSTGDSKWSGQQLLITRDASKPNVATGSRWDSCTFTMSADGQTLQAGNTTYTRQ